MQNAQIWKSIEALCNEAESVIKNGEPEITVIKSIAPPALACQSTPHTKAVNILSSKPAPPTANIEDRPTPKEDVVDAPLSSATMTEIAAAIDRASQTIQKPQIMDQPSQGMSDQLRKDLMIEISIAVRSVLENELPKLVRQSISESLYELINSTADPAANNLEALETRPKPKDEKKKITKKNKSSPIAAADVEGMSKRELEELGRDYGVELDRRYKKSTLVEQMEDILRQSDSGKQKAL